MNKNIWTKRAECTSGQTQEYETETDIKAVTKSVYILSQEHGLHYLLDVLGHTPRKLCKPECSLAARHNVFGSGVKCAGSAGSLVVSVRETRSVLVGQGRQNSAGKKREEVSSVEASLYQKTK